MAKPTIASQVFGAPTAPLPPVAGGQGSIADRVFGSSAAPAAVSGPDAAPVVVSAPEHHGGGGITGFLGHLVNQTASDLESAAINSVTGTYKLGKDLLTPASGESLGQQWDDLLHGHLHFAKGDPLAGDVQGIKQGYEDIAAHPLRHPGFTALSLLPLASGAAKLGIAAREGATGVEAGSSVARALTHNGLTVNPETSRSGLGQLTQKATDTLLQNAADKNPAGLGSSLLNRRISKTIDVNAKQAARNARGPAEALIRIGRKLTPGQQKALQVVAEEAPLDGRITAASARVTGAKDAAARARHQEELDLLHQAKPLLVDTAGKPGFAADQAHLERIYSQMAKVAGDRETLLKGLGLLADEGAAGRKTAAGVVALGGSHQRFFSPAPEDLAVGQAVRVAGRKTMARVAEIHPATLDGQTAHSATIFYPRFNRAERVLVDRLEVPGRVKTETVQRPRSVEDAQARLDKLQAAEGKQLDTMAKAMFGPADKREVMFRTRENAKAKQQASGKTKSGKASGASGFKAQVRPTVAEERRQLAQRAIDDQIAKNPDHPVLKRWADRTNEIDQLRAALQPEFGEPINTNALGATTETKVTRSRQASGIVGPDFHASENAIRIPDVATRKGARSLTKAAKIGGQGSVGHQKLPGSVTHGYTGALRDHGIRRQDTTRLVGESALEASKYAALKHLHEMVRKAAGKEPTRPDDIAVRLDNLKASATMPLEVRKFLSDPEEFFKTASHTEQQNVFEQVRQRLFINRETLTPEARAEFEKLNASGKVGWVPKRLLGELAKPQAPLRAVAPGKAVGGVDAINNATRFAILYLKPAYAIPNMLGNTALTLVQQGWAAPRNLAQAAKLIQKLHEDDYARIDASMGEGVARSVSAHGEGRLSRVVDIAASGWSKAVDTPFRRASFLYEARREGFKTPEQLHDLLTRDAHDPQLLRVGIRANRDSIDYENLTHSEREVVRRVVFLYPWIKGSTVYAGRFLREHPIAAAASVPTAQTGQQFTQEGFGAIPSNLQGLIPVGNSRAINPASAAILQTPAQVLEALQGVATGNIPEAAQAANFFTPALTLAAAEISRKKSNGVPYKPGTGFGSVALDTLTSSLPQVALAKALLGTSKAKLYPPSVSNALGQFLFGGTYPRKINKNVLNALAASEQTRLKTGR